MLFRSQKTTAGQAPEYLVVGLGNPGSQYECTRHNAGFIAMDIMAEKLGFDIKRLKFKGLIGDTVIDGHRVAFLKPSTFMNLSGESVRDAMQFYKIPVKKLLVIVMTTPWHRDGCASAARAVPAVTTGSRISSICWPGRFCPGEAGRGGKAPSRL